MPYSLQQAATACAVNRSTILRSIKSGRISASKNEFGEWQIEEVECHRIYPLVQTPQASTGALPGDARPDASGQAMAQQTDALVSELRAVISDLRQDRDHWRAAFELAQRQLPKPEAKPVTWWRWLRTA